MADQIAARSIRASLAQTCLARIVQHRQGTGPDLCARYRLHRRVWAERGATIEAVHRARKAPQALEARKRVCVDRAGQSRLVGSVRVAGLRAVGLEGSGTPDQVRGDGRRWQTNYMGWSRNFVNTDQTGNLEACATGIVSKSAISSTVMSGRSRRKSSAVVTSARDSGSSNVQNLPVALPNLRTRS